MRTPIISIGQVYLHTTNEYIVVTKSNQGQITLAGTNFIARYDVDTLLETCGPVDPEDLTENEVLELKALIPADKPLLVGWVVLDNEEDYDE